MLVLCHRVGDTEVEGYPGQPLLSLPELVELYTRVGLPARRPVVACLALTRRASTTTTRAPRSRLRRYRQGCRRTTPFASVRCVARRSPRSPLGFRGLLPRTGEAVTQSDEEHPFACRRRGRPRGGRPRFHGCCAGRRHRRERRHRQVLRRRRQRLLRADERPRPAADGHDRSLPPRPTRDDPGQGVPRQGRARRQIARTEGRLRDLSVSAQRAHAHGRRGERVRGLRRSRRARVPAGAAVRDRQRAQPAGLLAAPVLAQRGGSLGSGLRSLSRRRLRRSQGGRPRHQRSWEWASRRAATTTHSPGATSPRHPCASSRRSAPGIGRAVGSCH